MTEEEALQAAKRSQLTREQIRQALLDAGYSEAEIPSLMARGAAAESAAPASGFPIVPPGVGDAGGVPMGAESPAVAAVPPARVELRPEDYPQFTKEILRRVPGSTPIFPFGYEIFGYAPSTFEPLAAGPVDPDYPIGPGDEVLVTVWGDNEFTHAATVSREATITVPDIGQVVLNGLTLAQAKRLITDRLATVYSGIRARRPTTYVDVTLGKLRTIQVFILGDVVRPGGYTISSVSTVLNALYNAGGPTARGSMRDIRIIRHNEVYSHVDLYGYILTGSKADDVRLQTGDVVFVPPVGKSVGVLGEVHRPAIIELRAGERFHELMRLAGGVLTTAVMSRALVDRIVPFGERDSLRLEDRVAIDFPLGKILADSTDNPAMEDRDIVQVFRIGNVRRNTVTISGGVVWHPGLFQWREGMRVSDLVSEAGGLRPEAYLERATVVRTSEDSTRSIVPFNLRLALVHDPANDLVLQQLDEVAVRSIWDLEARYTVSIRGSVRSPGTYEFLEGMTVMDLIFRADGFLVSADTKEAEVSRVDSTTIATTRAAKIYQVPISGDYTVDFAAGGFRLQRWDQVFVREIPDWRLQRNVSVMGEVVYPGVYSLESETERLSSVLARTGGFKPTAYPQGATFVRKKGGAGRLAVNVVDAAKGKQKADLILDDGDSLYVPKAPRTVKVVGEVGFPVSVLYEKGKSLSYYIDQAGGYTELSDKGRVKVVQPNGKVEAKRHWSSPEPKDGALVIVPQKPPATDHDTLKDIATITTIIAGAVTSIFVIVEASK